MEKAELEELFELCDLDQSGYIEKNELRRACPNIDNASLEYLLEELDTDGDGKISLQELEKGVHKILAHQTNNAPNELKRSTSFGPIRSRSLSDLSPRRISRASLERTASMLSDNSEDSYSTMVVRKNSTIDMFKSLESHNEAFQIYCHLLEDGPMLQKFEVFIEEAMRRIKEKNREKEELEVVLQREQKKYQQRLFELEEEAENTSRKIEQQVALQLSQKFESDRAHYEEEITSLRDSLDKMKQLSNEIRQNAKQEMSPLKAKLHETEKALRSATSEKTEAETNMLIMKSQLASLRQNMEHHSEEREKDKELVMDYLTEKVNLARQVNQLQEANKYLHEANTDLQTEVVTLKRKISKRGPRRLRRTMKEELGSDTESGSDRLLPHNRMRRSGSVTLSLSEELERASTASSGHQDDDSPIFQRQQSQLLSSDDDVAINPVKGHSIISHSPHLDFSYHPELLQPEEDNIEYTANSPSIKQNQKTSPASSTSQISFERKQSASSAASINSEQSVSSSTPQRIYKVIFAGDSATGKSSFIMRLCRGEFNPTVKSTIGIDFQTTSVVVDQTKAALQLWDTAGQERFRCIATSYFRKADGVVLLYDCCSEKSFVNVREWVQSIKDLADSDLPIMICANKVDMREKQLESGGVVVSTDLGSKLAEECGAMFCETSAKTGENLKDALMQLARSMKNKEDDSLENFGTGMQLHEEKQSKKKCC